MARTYKNLIYSTAEYTKSYPAFKGVELNASASITDSSRLAYAENVYRDYEADGSDVVESIPGFRKLFSCGRMVNAIHHQHSSVTGDHMIVHAGNLLLRYPLDDTSGAPKYVGKQIATLRGQKSFSFSFGSFLYVMDGVNILRVDEQGNCQTISDDEASPYIPTTYISGEKYEERNLLTDLFKEEYRISDPAGFSYSTEGLKYTITDPNNRYCSVAGADAGLGGDLFIPAYVTISGVEYKVTHIDNYAFAKNEAITSVNISDGIKEIGLFAFYKCSGIETAVIPKSITAIGNGAFVDCTGLIRIYLGDGIEDIGIGSFANCTSFNNVYYSLDSESYKKIKNISALDGKSVVYETKYDSVTLAFDLHDDTVFINRVFIDGNVTPFEAVEKDGCIKKIIIEFPSSADATGATVVIDGRLCDERYDFSGGSDEGSAGVVGYDAINGCTIAEVFDRRIFFSGNPMLPNTVFYTDVRHESNSSGLYIGKYNYFNDGVGNYKVKSMLSVRDMLAIFKEDDDGSGSIFYHKRESLDSDSLSAIYPVAYIHSGICAKGPSLSFLDDPVFISEEGLSALDSPNINYQRNVVCRSHNVNFNLLKEDLSGISLCTWLGYLVVGVDGNVYLADSRSSFFHPTGNREYEWFMLTGIGTYTDDEEVYRFSYESNELYEANAQMAGKAVLSKNVFGSVTPSGEHVFYTEIEGEKYAVIPTEERSGGVFHPAKFFTSYNKLLYFATKNGDVCLFNNDMRGIAPDILASSPSFDPDEYALQMANKIHPYYYSFADHAPKYVIKTALDNCDIPHLTKNTVKKSLVIKARSYTSESIKCEVVTDKGECTEVGSFPSIDPGFDDFEFGKTPWSVGKYISYALAEKEKRWIEKQIVLSCEKYRCPISVYSITYRYSIKGKIKNNL